MKARMVIAPVVIAVGIGAAVVATIARTDPPANGPIKADAAVVLSGDVDYLRVKHGAELVQQGRVKALLLTGAGVGGDSAEAMKGEAMAAGVPASAIVLETASTSTRENFAFAAPIIRDRGWRRIALVTSQSHMARALATARRTMPEIEWIASPVKDAGAPDRARRLRAGEALKLLWYKARGWA
jgi:uncharacterized SAM-binding protein YcdF (DUF218 family)